MCDVLYMNELISDFSSFIIQYHTDLAIAVSVIFIIVWEITFLVKSDVDAEYTKWSWF